MHEQHQAASLPRRKIVPALERLAHRAPSIASKLLGHFARVAHVILRGACFGDELPPERWRQSALQDESWALGVGKCLPGPIDSPGVKRADLDRLEVEKRPQQPGREPGVQALRGRLQLG